MLPQFCVGLKYNRFMLKSHTPVHKVLVQKVHPGLWGHMHFDLAVSPLLREITHRPRAHTGPQGHALQNRWSTLNKTRVIHLPQHGNKWLFNIIHELPADIYPSRKYLCPHRCTRAPPAFPDNPFLTV